MDGRSTSELVFTTASYERAAFRRPWQPVTIYVRPQVILHVVHFAYRFRELLPVRGPDLYHTMVSPGMTPPTEEDEIRGMMCLVDRNTIDLAKISNGYDMVDV